MAKHCLFYAAIMPTYSKYFTLTDQEIFEKSPNLRACGKTARWPCEKDSFFYYPYILLSAAHHYKAKKITRETCQFTDETQVMVDSGGYQIATGVVDSKYNEAEALKWSEANGDVYPIVDRPITAGCNWDENMDLTCAAAEYYLDHRSKPDHHILNVVSGKGGIDTERWYNRVKDYPFDGWAHGGHRGNMKSILSTLFFLYNKGEFDRDELTYYHIFGVVSFDAVLYLNAFQKWLHEQGNTTVQITYDASTQTKTLAYGKLIKSNDWNGLKTLSLSNKIDFSNHNTTKMYCDCPVCQNITDMKSLFVDNRTFEFYYILHQHNLYQLIKMKEMVEWMMELTPGYKYDKVMVDGSMPVRYGKNLEVLYRAFENPKIGDGLIHNQFQWTKPESGSKRQVDLTSYLQEG